MSIDNEQELQAKLYNALAQAQAKIRRVRKSSKNAHHNYNYASAEDIIEEARTALSSSGLSVFVNGWEIVGKEPEATITVYYCIAHKDGGSKVFGGADMPLVVEKGRPRDKATATALTYNLSYFLRGLLLIPRSDKAEAVHGGDVRNDTGFKPGKASFKAKSEANAIHQDGQTPTDELRLWWKRDPDLVNRARQA